MKRNLAADRVFTVFKRLSGDHDQSLGAGPYDARVSPDGHLTNGVARVVFCSAQHRHVVTIAVYENRTFRIQQSMCTQELADLVAYHRAVTFLRALKLEDAK